MSIYQGNNKLLGGITNIEENKVKEIIDNERPIKTFTNITQLGLSAGCSVEDIFLALPNNSYFECGTASGVDGYSTITNLPTTSTSTLLTIRKYTQARFNIEVKISSSGDVEPNEMYIGQLKGSDGTGLTWSRVCTTKVADVSTTYITFSDETNYKNASSSLNYFSIKNGICHASLYFKCLTPSSSTLYVTTNLPTPKNNVRVFMREWSLTGASTDNILVSLNMNSTSMGLSCGTANKSYVVQFSYPVAES